MTQSFNVIRIPQKANFLKLNVYHLSFLFWGPHTNLPPRPLPPATLFGGTLQLVFNLVLFIFLACVGVTLTSFREIPLDVLTMPDRFKNYPDLQYSQISWLFQPFALLPDCPFLPTSKRKSISGLVPGKETEYGSLSQVDLEEGAGDGGLEGRTREGGLEARTSGSNPFRAPGASQQETCFTQKQLRSQVTFPRPNTSPPPQPTRQG